MTDNILDLSKDIITPVSGVVTQEILDTELAEGKFDRLSSFVSEGINKEQLIYELGKTGDDYVSIEDFWGGAENPVAILEQDVPEDFPSRLKVKMVEEEFDKEVFEFNEDTGKMESQGFVPETKLVPDLDEEGEPIMIPKLFREYCTNYRISVDGTSVLFKLGYTDSHGNLLHKVSDLELRSWVNKFSIDNITVYRDWKALATSNKYVSPSVE